jgi:hypothetical protein
MALSRTLSHGIGVATLAAAMTRRLQTEVMATAIVLSAFAFVMVGCSSSTEPGSASPIHSTFTASPASARVGDSVRAEWTMINSGASQQSIDFAPAGPGNEYFIGITATPENTVLQTVDDELLLVSDGLTFSPHEQKTFRAVYVAAEAGQAAVQACLPTNVDGDDPWVCKSVTVSVHN